MNIDLGTCTVSHSELLRHTSDVRRFLVHLPACLEWLQAGDRGAPLGQHLSPEERRALYLTLDELEQLQARTMAANGARCMAPPGGRGNRAARRAARSGPVVVPLKRPGAA